MHNFAKVVALTLLSIALVGCTSDPKGKIDVDETLSPDVLYSQARQSMELGNYTKAVASLEALDSRYPFGPYKIQVQLDLIYAYYKQKDPISAIANIDRFIRLNPTHKNIDYVYYMRGLVNMQTDSYLFHKIFNVDRTDRDPSAAKNAFRDFNHLLIAYPNSKYAADAQKRMQFLKNRLARYSIGVAQYYIKIKAWSAAADRAQNVMESYPQTPSTEAALEIMAKAYGELGQKQLKDHVLTVMKANFPDNKLVR